MQTPLVLVTGFSVTSVRWGPDWIGDPAVSVRRIEFTPGLPDVQAGDKFFAS